MDVDVHLRSRGGDVGTKEVLGVNPYDRMFSERQNFEWKNTENFQPKRPPFLEEKVQNGRFLGMPFSWMDIYSNGRYLQQMFF